MSARQLESNNRIKGKVVIQEHRFNNVVKDSCTIVINDARDRCWLCRYVSFA